MFELNISSPKISAYLKGKLSTVGQNKNEISLIKKVTQMYVEPDTVEHDDEKEYMKSKVNRIKILSSKLNNLINVPTTRRQLKLFTEKMDNLVQHIDENIFLTPLRTPKRH